MLLVLRKLGQKSLALVVGTLSTRIAEIADCTSKDSKNGFSSASALMRPLEFA
ncbi:hypothetical protein ARTSIC4J27_2194 [Pseudarthrobacter siccitolerans]|uniref:Uncharacterized protein n=1 Tax=Pseudarthrobacter siccitolerans TaxID=861266 RepID=A0A024H384_9MICC|nr:hypothetical protein ARTSIC4J27_2194 [Pseudarthrobacter siccitolerans]